MVEKGNLPALEIVGLVTSRTTGELLNKNKLFSTLRQKDVDVFIIDPYLEENHD